MKNKKKIITVVSILFLIYVIGIGLLFEGKEDEKWIQKGNVITKGNESYKVGDYYDYDESNNGNISGLTDVKWKVFKVEDGNLVIMSSSNITNISLGSEDNLVASQNDYLNGKSKLNEVASLYGKGNGSVGARSVTIEDINSIMEYDKDNYVGDTFGDYNSEISYYFTNNNHLLSEDKNGNRDIVSNKHDSFTYLNINKFETINKTELDENNLEFIATIKNDFYTYSNESIHGSNVDAKNFSEDSLEYKMLFLDESGNKANYFLASNFTSANNIMVGYGYWVVKGSDINYNYLLYSMGKTREVTSGIRALVMIK